MSSKCAVFDEKFAFLKKIQNKIIFFLTDCNLLPIIVGITNEFFESKNANIAFHMQ
jgi:hypothetical protein